MHLETLAMFAARTVLQVESVGMEWTDDASPSDHPFGQRSLAVRTAVLRGKQPAVALAEDGDLFSAYNIAAALTHGDSAHAPQTDGRRRDRFSHCSRRPP